MYTEKKVHFIFSSFVNPPSTQLAPLGPPRPPSPARVHVVLADAASEEALAAITAGRPVVFSCGSVSTYGTQAAHPHVDPCVHVGALSR